MTSKNIPFGLSMLASAGIAMPQESMLEVKKSRQELYIGIPKETSFEENRIALVPEAVGLLVANGHRIVVEAGAGANANFTDNDYSEAGAQIVYSPKEAYDADLILKIAPPSEQEILLMHDRQTLFSILAARMQKKDYLKRLADKKITALGFDFLRDQLDMLPVVKAMSEIVGSTAILIAAEYLSNNFNGKGELLGGITGIPPSDVVILGAGIVGEFATRTALGLGANVKVFDNSVYKLKRLQNNIGQRVYTSIISPNTLGKALRNADVVIGAVYSPEGRTPCIVTEDMVSEMKFGSVIVDVSIDQGGCFETSEVTTHSAPIYRKYGVIHYCVPNIASRVSRTASYAMSNIFSPILLQAGEAGGVDDLIWKDRHVRAGIYLYKGTVTNRFASELFSIPYRDLNLLIASRI